MPKRLVKDIINTINTIPEEAEKNRQQLQQAILVNELEGYSKYPPQTNTITPKAVELVNYLRRPINIYNERLAGMLEASRVNELEGLQKYLKTPDGNYVLNPKWVEAQKRANIQSEPEYITSDARQNEMEQKMQGISEAPDKSSSAPTSKAVSDFYTTNFTTQPIESEQQYYAQVDTYTQPAGIPQPAIDINKQKQLLFNDLLPKLIQSISNLKSRGLRTAYMAKAIDILDKALTSDVERGYKDMLTRAGVTQNWTEGALVNFNPLTGKWEAVTPYQIPTAVKVAQINQEGEAAKAAVSLKQKEIEEAYKYKQEIDKKKLDILGKIFEKPTMPSSEEMLNYIKLMDPNLFDMVHQATMAGYYIADPKDWAVKGGKAYITLLPPNQDQPPINLPLDVDILSLKERLKKQE